MYPKYRIVEMTNDTYRVQWKPFFLSTWDDISHICDTLQLAKDYIAWSKKDDQEIRDRRNIKIKRIIQE